MANILDLPGFLHGGDYNPDQWLDRPEVLDADLDHFDKAGINTVTLAIFSWARLEPTEGDFDFGWLRDIIDRLHERGVRVLLATPSGSRPRWMAEAYPEVLRVDQDGIRDRFGTRHNHCYTSPVYRQKVAKINATLAEDFAGHPAVVGWHLSNEYGGECHCDLCRAEFRRWVARRYGHIEELNRAWYTDFWGHRFASFTQVDSPSPRGESLMHGLLIDWKRFVTDSTVDFMRAEIDALRAAGAHQTVFTNFMYDFTALNYAAFAPYVDVISWDNYPRWHTKPDSDVAADVGLEHDFMRSMKQQPFLLMESSPSATNWAPVSKLLRPGMHIASSLQAVAHGSDSVLYFQLRQSRGGYEKFHGAVIDHYGGDDTRVFREVASVGAGLDRLAEVAGSWTSADVAVVHDVENRWAVEGSAGPRNAGIHYRKAVRKAHRAFRRLGLNVDVVAQDTDLSRYRVVVAPLAYMFRNGFSDTLREFVARGGVLVMSYWSGVVNENDLAFLGAAPHDMTDVLGLRRTEIDALLDGDTGTASATATNTLGLRASYSYSTLCELIEVSTAEVVATYDGDFYAGQPAVTRNDFGEGYALFVGADFDADFHDALARAISDDLDLSGPVRDLPDGVEVTTRHDDTTEYVFLQNFGTIPVEIDLVGEQGSALLGDPSVPLAPLGSVVLKRTRVARDRRDESRPRRFDSVHAGADRREVRVDRL